MEPKAISEVKRETKQLYRQHVELGIENSVTGPETSDDCREVQEKGRDCGGVAGFLGLVQRRDWRQSAED